MSPPPYVAMAHDDHWVVKRCSGLWWPLVRLGFRGLPFVPTLRLRRHRPMSFEEMARLAGSLRDLGVAFGAGREWSPSEVVQDLKDRGLVSGEFTEIAWTGEAWRLRAI